MNDKNARPLLAPCFWEKRHPKLRFTLMLAKLALLVVSEFSTMYRQLQAIVDTLAIVAVTGPSPSKSALKVLNVGLAANNSTLVADLTNLTTKNTELLSALDSMVWYMYMVHPLHGFSSEFLWIFL